MARPLRIEFPGACYHVICRGNFCFPLFADDEDKSLVLERLVEFADDFSVRIRACCVMVNHIHCHLKTEEANLGRYVQSFLTSFCVSYNRRHHTSGHEELWDPLAAVRVGMARGHWDEEGERFDGDADLFFGIGARTTVWDEDDWTVGAFAQADWAETDGDIEGTGWAGDSSVEFVHIRVGAGPTYQLTDRIRVYGGPFWQIIDGDKDYDERMPAPGYAEEFDLESCSSYGGYVGAQIQLFPQATGCIEWQFGGGDSVVGVTVLWVFGSDR